MWTKFSDLYSGGHKKTQFEVIFIELPEYDAVEYFEKEFGIDPHNTTCSCCGFDFSIYEVDKPESGYKIRIIDAEEISCK